MGGLATNCLSHSTIIGRSHFGQTVRERYYHCFIVKSEIQDNSLLSRPCIVVQRKVSCQANDANKISASCLELDVSFSNDYYDKNGLLMIKNLTFPELCSWCVSIGEFSLGSCWETVLQSLTLSLLYSNPNEMQVKTRRGRCNYGDGCTEIRCG